MNKRVISLYIGGFLFFVLTACTLFGVTIGAGAEFNIGIESPIPGETLPPGPVEIVYYASSSDGIAEVELSIDDEVVNSVASDDGQTISVLEYVWTPESAGEYLIRVRARNDDGVWSEYEEISVTVAEGEAPTATPTQVPTATPVPAPTAVPFEIFDVDADVFTFYYGDDDCGTRDVTITARVNYPGQVYNMVLFTRFADQESNQTTGWDSGRPMTKTSDDTYSVTLDSEDIPNYNEYEFATMFYQIVATRENDTELGRTTVFKDVHLEICPQPSTPSFVRFKNYSHDVDTFYYGGTTCGENEVTITTDVTRPGMVEYVILFTRFKDKYSDNFTDWDSGTTMQVVDSDTHRITLRANELDNYNEYDFAEMSYQFIATNEDDDITGRSLVFDDISIEICP